MTVPSEQRRKFTTFELRPSPVVRSGPQHPCALDFSTCATGPAGGSGKVFYCDMDSPHGALPNGAGTWCYESYEACNSGANDCGDATTPCQLQPGLCSTGVSAGGASAFYSYNWACVLDIPPGALPIASGAYCYSDSLSCLQGPNGCSESFPCQQMAATCSTGVAGGSTAHNYFCPFSMPYGAIPNGGGQACSVLISLPTTTLCLVPRLISCTPRDCSCATTRWRRARRGPTRATQRSMQPSVNCSQEYAAPVRLQQQVQLTSAWQTCLQVPCLLAVGPCAIQVTRSAWQAPTRVTRHAIPRLASHSTFLLPPTSTAA